MFLSLCGGELNPFGRVEKHSWDPDDLSSICALHMTFLSGAKGSWHPSTGSSFSKSLEMKGRQDPSRILSFWSEREHYKVRVWDASGRWGRPWYAWHTPYSSISLLRDWKLSLHLVREPFHLLIGASQGPVPPETPCIPGMGLPPLNNLNCEYWDCSLWAKQSCG